MGTSDFNEHNGCSVELCPENRGPRRGGMIAIPGTARVRGGG